MQINGAVAVVTGGASGIGAALVSQLAREGVRSVTVADLDAAAAREVAEQVGAEVEGVAVRHAGCDVTDESQVRHLVARVEQLDGNIDLFCANAGVATGQGIHAPDDVWRRAIDVNVMAHVYAARALVPGWCERGRGHLLITASAAGLLTNLGDAPYSVSKHAAVAFAEWVAITYGDDGVGVSCLCPQGVRTPLLFGDGSSVDGGLAARVVKAQRILEPQEVARVTLAGLAQDRFLILPHEEVAVYEQARAADRERWLRSLRRLQARLGPG